MYQYISSDLKTGFLVQTN